MSGMLPEGDPPQVGPLWRDLAAAPCRQCGSGRLFPAGMRQSGIPAGPARAGDPDTFIERARAAGQVPADQLDRLAVGPHARLTLTVLCGDCGDVHDRPGWSVAT